MEAWLGCAGPGVEGEAMTAFTTNPLITAWRDNGYVVVTPDGVEIRDPDGKPFESRQLAERVRELIWDECQRRVVAMN